MQTLTRKNRLTKKERNYVKEYIKTGGDGTIAALRSYDVEKSKSPMNTAAAISSENLNKPHIVKAIQEMLPDDLLAERHLELLNKREVRITRINGQEEKELIDSPDTQAVTRALDMAYKIKGSYAPEKRIIANITLKTQELSDEELEELAYKPIKAEVLSDIKTKPAIISKEELTSRVINGDKDKENDKQNA